MQLTIKVLKGQDFDLEVTPATTINDIKRKIESKINIPHVSQKLLLLGRTLNDESTIAAYPNIKDGSTLNLVVMKEKEFGLKESIHRSFRKYYNERQSERLTQEFMADFEKKLKSMSVEDLERLAYNSING